jgi:hypothetical protein
MSYKGYQIRFNRTQGIWQAVAPLDLTWSDGPQAKTKKELAARIDCELNGF